MRFAKSLNLKQFGYEDLLVEILNGLNGVIILNIETTFSEMNVKRWMVESIAKMMFMPYEEVDCNSNLYELGLDSIELMGLITELEDWVGCRFPQAIIENLNNISFIVKSAMELKGGNVNAKSN